MKADKYNDCYVNKTDTVHPCNSNTKLLKFSIYSPWDSQSVLGTQNMKSPDNVF